MRVIVTTSESPRECIKNRVNSRVGFLRIFGITCKNMCPTIIKTDVHLLDWASRRLAVMRTPQRVKVGVLGALWGE